MTLLKGCEKRIFFSLSFDHLSGVKSPVSNSSSTCTSHEISRVTLGDVTFRVLPVRVCSASARSYGRCSSGFPTAQLCSRQPHPQYVFNDMDVISPDSFRALARIREEPGEPDKTITQTTSSPSQFKQHRVSQWEEKVDKEKDARDVGCNNHLLPGVL